MFNSSNRGLDEEIPSQQVAHLYPSWGILLPLASQSDTMEGNGGLERHIRKTKQRGVNEIAPLFSLSPLSVSLSISLHLPPFQFHVVRFDRLSSK